MTIGLVGRKLGMTRIFTDDGTSLPVTVLDVSDNRVTQVKTAETGAARRQGGRGAAGGPRPIGGERALPSLSRRG